VLFPVIGPVIGLFVTVVQRIKALSAPGWADLTSAGLDAGVEASGPHDFAVRVSAVRQLAVRSLTGQARPAITSRAQPLPRPPHPRPTSVRIASTYRGTEWQVCNERLTDPETHMTIADMIDATEADALSARPRRARLRRLSTWSGRIVRNGASNE
jgi:hypothetical protein